MLKSTLIVLMTLLPSVVSADLTQGKQLFDKGNCLDCHNIEKLKPRKEKINSFTKLHNIVDACAFNSGAAWDEDEVMDVAEYLNHHYYKFKIK